MSISFKLAFLLVLIRCRSVLNQNVNGYSFNDRAQQFRDIVLPQENYQRNNFGQNLNNGQGDNTFIQEPPSIQNTNYYNNRQNRERNRNVNGK